MRFPSIGLVEIIILAIIAGFVLLVGGLVVLIVARRRKEYSSRVDSQSGSGTTTSRSSNLSKWLFLLGLAAVLLCPLAVIGGGILMITPVKRTQMEYEGPAPEVHVVEMSTPAGATPAVTPVDTPQPVLEPGGQSAVAPPPGPATLSIRPDSNLIYLIPPAIAGLVVLVGGAAIAAVLRIWQGGKDAPPRDLGPDGDNGAGWTRAAWLRYALLAFAIWFALSIFLILDVSFSVSVYWPFLAIYAAFCLLIGALLLVGSPSRVKLLILGLLVVVLFSIRLFDWNSRKPFLKDFYRVKEGMTVDQVEQIMGSYMGGPCEPTLPSEASGGQQAIETAVLAEPDRAVYRHTDEGWGNSDWGEVTFEEGRVVEIQFLPD
jgi:hypothetical protein